MDYLTPSLHETGGNAVAEAGHMAFDVHRVNARPLRPRDAADMPLGEARGRVMSIAVLPPPPPIRCSKGSGDGIGPVAF